MAKRRPHRYPDAEKALALASLEAGNGVRQTAREMGVPISTMMEWKQGQGYDSEGVRLTDQYKRRLADKTEELAHKLIGSMLATTDEELAEIKLKDRAISYGIAVDKTLLLRGQPTSISAHADPENEEEAARELARLLSRVEAYLMPGAEHEVIDVVPQVESPVDQVDSDPFAG